MKTLPEMQPSALLRLALGDMDLAERHPDYEVSMYDWHGPITETDVCEVCLAGAVIAFSLDGKWSDRLGPHSFLDGSLPTRTSRYLHALDHFRCGKVTSGVRSMGIGPSEWPVVMGGDVVQYGEDAELFRRDMWTIVAQLEEAGL